MNRKTRTLSPDDRQAIDLLLDNAATAAGVVRMATGVPQPRLAAATKVLALLDLMPAAEPPPGLATQTLAAIGGLAARPPAASASVGVAAFH